MSAAPVLCRGSGCQNIDLLWVVFASTNTQCVSLRSHFSVGSMSLSSNWAAYRAKLCVCVCVCLSLSIMRYHSLNTRCGHRFRMTPRTQKLRGRSIHSLLPMPFLMQYPDLRTLCYRVRPSRYGLAGHSGPSTVLGDSPWLDSITMATTS